MEQTPKNVEQDLLKEQTNGGELKETSAEEVAAQLFYLYSPKFGQGLNSLSKKALQRLIMKLVTYPLNEKQLKHQSELEKNMFLIGDRLLESKYVMIIQTMMNNQDVIQAAVNKLEENKEENISG